MNQNRQSATLINRLPPCSQVGSVDTAKATIDNHSDPYRRASS